ncbi:MAG: radical SAM protein [bacterium]|nr:radical SAM protein [bacterium]
MPLPRRDLLKRDRYLTTNVVQTARGCPNGCSFCSVTAISGRRYRFRPVQEVVEEVRSLKGWIGFVDDNIVGHGRRAKELFEALIPLKRRWVGQGDLSMAKDPELMKLAVRSGCQALFMGLESVSPENLLATSKRPNVGLDMGDAIRKIHKAGIEIIGSFVLGLDGDGKDVFKRTAAFAIAHQLVAAQFSVITPYPGTVIREQLKQEDRVLSDDWSKYTMSDVVIKPKNMTPQELQDGQKATYRDFYSMQSIVRRALTLRKKLFLRIIVNLSYRFINRGKGLHNWLPKH